MDELPPIVTRLLADIADLETGLAKGDALVKAYRDSVAGSLGDGHAVGEKFGKDISDGAVGLLRDTPPLFAAAGRDAGDAAGFNFTEAMGGRVRGELPEKVEQPIEDSGKKAGAKGGQAAGKGFAGGMSPLILGAFAGVATAGPGLVLAGVATAVIVVAAMASKGNARLADSYRQLGADASNALTKATEPLIPQIQASINILDQGVRQIGPELKGVFAAVAPDATAITGGFVQLAERLLPGVESGLRAIAPYAKEIGDDLGRIGAGIGGLFSGLGQGAAGGTAGFTALATGIERLLPDIGAIVGDLSNGLGPALQDVMSVAIPAADALAELVHALPPRAVEDAAVATAALFAAFKIGGLVGAVAEGTTFLAFVKGAVPAETALATETTVLSASFSAMLGPLGAAVALIPLLTSKAGTYALATADMGGKTQDLSSFVKTLGTEIKSSGDLGRQAGSDLDLFVGSLKSMQASGANISPTLAALDSQMLKLKDSNPALAAKEYNEVLKDLGVTAQQGAADFPLYAASIGQVGTSSASAAVGADDLTVALAASRSAAVASAQQSATGTLAALGFTKGISSLTDSLYASLTAYSASSGAASAYGTVLDATFGKFGNYSAAEAAFTTGLANASKQLTHGKDAIDLNTTAGAANFTVLKSLSDLNETRAEKLLTETGSQDQANKSLQAGALALDATAKNAHFTKDQIDALNLALYGTKNIGDIKVPISADTSGATKALNSLIHTINTSYGTVQVRTSTTGLGMSTSRGAATPSIYDVGGWTRAAPGQPESAVVHGGEYVLSQDMLSGRSQIDPGVVAALAARSATSAAAAGSGSAGVGRAGATVVNNYYTTVQGSLLAESQLYDTVQGLSLRYEGRNSTNGLSLPA